MATNFLADNVLDNGLVYLTNNVTALYICSALPGTYAAATTTNALGSKTTPTVSSPAARTGSGRKVTVSAINDGSVGGTGTASHWALVKTATSELIAAGPLTGTQSVTSGNTFTLTAFDIGIPAPA